MPMPPSVEFRQAAGALPRSWNDPWMPFRLAAISSVRRSPRGCCALLLVAASLTAMPMPSHATEEPEYQVVQPLAEDVELRQYAPYTVAEVVVPGPAGEAGQQAFSILAGYIFGKNKEGRKFEMTAPVTQAAVPAPLETPGQTKQSAAPGGYRVQFILPKGVTPATAPEPADARVLLREIAAEQVAVIRYSGFWSQSNYDEHLSRLQAQLRAAGLAWTGEPVYSRYNAPFTPWFMRRNEIWLTLAKAR
ncbi:SOUL family heme-binding protein [Rubrivivax gelatinosus]|uniref:SOUL family heme-binding protein n=1 Tax=Rubrivivax gelatinosus TaxID=28068 RepID=UPI00190551BE|nr:heme-binding protein [Rubrivivax gelatinosus]